MKNRETFNFYRSFFEAGKDMSDEDRLAFYDAILISSFEGRDIELSGLSKIVFTAIKPVIDNQTANYINGKKGGRPTKNNPPLVKKNNPPLLKKESYKEKEKDNNKYTSFFESMWKWYKDNTDRPIGDKQKASKSLEKNLKKHSEDEMRKILVNYINECKKTKTFTKHLVSLLNGDLSEYLNTPIEKSKAKREPNVCL